MNHLKRIFENSNLDNLRDAFVDISDNWHVEIFDKQVDIKKYIWNTISENNLLIHIKCKNNLREPTTFRNGDISMNGISDFSKDYQEVADILKLIPEALNKSNIDIDFIKIDICNLFEGSILVFIHLQ